ncbi:MAG: metal-dependent transcriptional regulator [Oscillospiraceae bacterium]|nr:metal-dependent transcriptional regulator [Oscillospiraceae bacterium]
MHLPRAMEDYLKTIWILQRENGSVRSLDVAETLHVSKPSVSRAMKLLREGGLLTIGADKRLTLTDAGREAAEQVYRKHRALRTLLISLGVRPETAERDACGMEHIVSDETLDSIVEHIGEEVAP